MSNQRPSRFSLKSLIWFGLLILGAFGFYFGLPIIGDGFARVQRATRIDSALNLIEARRAEAGVLTWLPDDPSPRQLEPFRRDQISSEYLLAFEELSYAHASGDITGLRSYFQGPALEDANLSMSAQKANLASWDHHLRLRFYSPDGATVAFTDTYWSAQALERGLQMLDPRIEQRTMDVVFKLDDGNWRVHHWRVLQSQTLPETHKPIAGLAFLLSQVRGVNYVGRSHPFGQFWTNFDANEMRSSLRLARELKFNTIRIFIPFPTPEEVYTHLPEVLKEATKNNLQVIVTLLDSYTHYQIEDLPKAFETISRLVPILRQSSVLALDLKNEAERDAKTAGWDHVRVFLGFFAQWLRAQTGLPITAGLSDPDPDLSRSFDFTTVHHYTAPTALAARLENALKLGKPVLLEEFGFHSQLDKLPDPHSENDQARYYAAVLEVAKAQKTGFMVWNLHDFPNGVMPAGREVERFLGVLRNDGTLKPAARVLQGATAPTQSLQDIFAKLVALSLRYILWLGVGMLGVWLVWRRFSRPKTVNSKLE
jgi:hypothetical protein